MQMNVIFHNWFMCHSGRCIEPDASAFVVQQKYLFIVVVQNLTEKNGRNRVFSLIITNNTQFTVT